MKRKIIVLICVLLLIAFAVAAIIAAPKIRKSQYPREFSQFVTVYANKYSVPEALVYSVIKAESNFNPNAQSHVGAMGLMQLMPDTLDWLGRVMGEAPQGTIKDPETNIKYGTYYLSFLYNRFTNWETAVAAYNAGHGRVASWLSDSRYSSDGVTLKVIPYEETRNYVNRVFENYKNYNKLYYNEED